MLRHFAFSLTLFQGLSGLAAAAPPEIAGASFPFAGAKLAVDPITPASLNESVAGTGSEPAVPPSQAISQSAHLANVKGTVLVNSGQGFQPVTGEAALVPGDRVRAVDGSAEVVYWNGATVPVQNGQMVVVLSEAPSAGGWFGEVSTPVLIGGGAALAGIGAGIVLLGSQSTKTNPASP